MAAASDGLANAVWIANTQSTDSSEITPVACYQLEPVLEGGRRDERIGRAKAKAPPNSARILGNRSVDPNFVERFKKLVDASLIRIIAGIKLAASNDGIRRALERRREWPRTAQMVDTNIGVQK